MRIPDLKDIIPHINKRSRVLAFDPGETTGICYMREMEIKPFQLDTGPDDFDHAIAILQDCINTYTADCIVIEDYRVYSWKSDDHKFSNLHTPQLIGVIRTLAHQTAVSKVALRMAVTAKQFVTDDKLKSWGIWEQTRAQKHARDAVRHAVYQKVFG